MFRKEDIKFFLDVARNNWRSYYSDAYCFTRKFILRKQPVKEDFSAYCLHFEVTNVCNSRCRYCLLSKKLPTETGVMPFDVFKKAIDDFVAAGGKTISFTPIVGEPLLDPGLIAKIEYAMDLPSLKEIYFFTNGTLLLRNENYKKLIDTGIKAIEVSIAATDEKMFKQMQQIDLYQQTIEGINKLLEYNRQKGEKTKIGINFRSPVMPGKILASPDFKKYIEPFLGPNVSYAFMASFDNWCGNIKKSDLPGVIRMKRINRFKYLPCVRLHDAVLLFDGSLRLCCHRIKDISFDELVVGNIKKNSLKEILSSKEVERINDSFFVGKIPPVCKDCSLYVPATKKYEI